MPQEVPLLDDFEVDAIRDVVGIWGEVHPRRDEPLIRLADGSELTPAAISRAVRMPRSTRGQLMYRVFAYGTTSDEFTPGQPVEELLEPYRRDIAEWGGAAIE